MNIQTKKYELIHQIIQVNDESLIDMVQNLLEFGLKYHHIMGKVILYKSIVKQIITNVLQQNGENDSIKEQLIVDEPNGHYVIFMNGWQDESRFYGCLAHIEVKKNGRIWVHEDRTDSIIVDKLLEKGIPKQDIVIGFHAPIMRGDTEFAVA